MAAGDGEINSGADVYSYSQIIQGVLILLSSLVAVGGYLVQSRAAKQQHILETRLHHLRNLLETHVGPAQSLALCANGLRMCLLKYIYVTHKGQSPFSYKAAMSDIYGEDALKEVISGNICEYYRLVSKETEAEIINDPQSSLAIQYRRVIRLMVYEYMVPLAKLLSTNMGIFPLPEREDFKRRFPGHRSGTLRKTFMLWQCAWTAEMKTIIEQEWDKGIFDRPFTAIAPYPTHCISLLSGMLSDLKKEIERLTEGEIRAKDNLSMEQQTKLSLKNICSPKSTSVEKSRKEVVLDLKNAGTVNSAEEAAAGTKKYTVGGG